MSSHYPCPIYSPYNCPIYHTNIRGQPAWPYASDIWHTTSYGCPWYMTVISHLLVRLEWVPDMPCLHIWLMPQMRPNHVLNDILWMTPIYARHAPSACSTGICLTHVAASYKPIWLSCILTYRSPWISLRHAISVCLPEIGIRYVMLICMPFIPNRIYYSRLA